MIFYACSKGMLVLDKGESVIEDTVLTDITASTKEKVGVWDTEDFTYEKHTLGEVYKLAKKDSKLFGPLADIVDNKLNITICNRFALSHSGPKNEYDYYRLDNFWILYKNSKDKTNAESYITLYLDKSNKLYINNEFICDKCTYISNPYLKDGKIKVVARKKSNYITLSLDNYMRAYTGDGVIIGTSFMLKSIDPMKYRVNDNEEPDASLSVLENNLICK